VYASSAEIYGDNATLPLSEQAKPHPLTAYGTDKLACEFYARMISMLHKVPTIGVRLFNVYGPRQHPESHYSGIISRMIGQLMQGKPVPLPGSGEQEVDFIYINDVVQLLTAAMQQPMQTHEVINACTGKMTSIRQMAAILATIIDHPLRTFAQTSGNCFIRTKVGDPSRAIRLLGLKSGTKLGDGLALTVRHTLKKRKSGKHNYTSSSPAWQNTAYPTPR
jgi:UDP-glucose 4-epimerase